MVSIIILTHNQWDFTEKCLDSIKRYTPGAHEIILVDNASTDGTPQRATALGIDKLIENKKNLGFAMGCNQGVLASEGTHILFLNNDVVVTRGWTERLLKHMNEDERVGVVGPVSNSVAGFQQIPVDYRDINGLAAFGERLALVQQGKRRLVPRLIGFCMLAKREVIDAVGGFDTRYGQGNFEDDDLSIRALVAGYQLAVADDVFIHHFGSVTFRGAKIDITESMERNWQIFRSKWGVPDDADFGHWRADQILAAGHDPKELYVDPSIGLDISLIEDAAEAAKSTSSDPIMDWSSTARNDPCPCGSGKKFKKCHG